MKYFTSGEYECVNVEEAADVRGIWIYFQLGITHLNSFAARMTIQFLERVAFTSLPPRKKRRSEMDQAGGGRGIYTGNTPSDSNYWYLYVPVNCRPGIIYDEESVANTKICFTVATRRQYAEKLWVSRRVQLSKERYYYFEVKSNVKNGITTMVKETTLTLIIRSYFFEKYFSWQDVILGFKDSCTRREETCTNNGQIEEILI